jgi:hypothetical protein
MKALVPGVKLTLRNEATLREWKDETNGDGYYSFSQLLPGTYTLLASRDGFQTIRQTVVLSVKEALVQNLDLKVGSPATIIDVTAPAGPNRANAQLGTAFDPEIIKDLPLPARNLPGLLSLYPGVNMTDKPSELVPDAGGQVDGARNDQQNLELDNANVNQQEQGGAFQSVLPITPDSVQGFVVQTAGFDGFAGRGSGGQVQLVTRSGTNSWHGVVYENYRTTGTSARNFFLPEATPLIRHLPGFAVGGPILRNKLYFFGAYEYHSDRSATSQTRSVPTPEFLNGTVRYLRTDGTFGTLTTGPNSHLATLTLVPGDTWNPAVIGPAGMFEQYRPFSTDAARTSPSAADGGANILTYRFNAPFTRDRNVYISRLDYNINPKNSIYARGTLNDDVRTLLLETFPGFNNDSERVDNSKGFSVNWNSSIAPTLNSSFSVGLTRESFEDSGNQAPNYNPQIFTTLFQTSGATRQFINTWNVSETVSWKKGRHNLQGGFSHRFIDNNFKTLAPPVVTVPTYSGAANVTGNIGSPNSPPLRRALGDAEFAMVASPSVVGDAVMVGTGSISKFSETAQFDLSGQALPGASPFSRNLLLKEWDFFVQDTFNLKQNLTVNYGLHYSLQTPPWEANGVQKNWTDNLGRRWEEMRNTTKASADFPQLTAELAGRANGLPDYYETDTNNFAPRVSVAWAIGSEDGAIGRFANKGGPLIVRAGYALTFDHIGARIGREAAIFGSIGMVASYTSPNNSFSIDGLNGPYAPRLGPGGSLPRSSFPLVPLPSDTLPTQPGGVGTASTVGIDPHLHSPTNHLLNFTLSKQLPGGWIVEGSYIGRFARDLLGQVDIASPVNVRDAVSGMTWYEATDQLFTRYLDQGAPESAVQPIAWFENVYPEMKSFVEGRLGTTFASATQAWYAYLLRQNASSAGIVPGPNAGVTQIDRYNELERFLGRNKLLNSQIAFLGLFGNFSKSNYHSAQFTAQKPLARGVSVTMNYTLSKSMDITSAAEARGNKANALPSEGIAADPLNPDRSYALSDFDRRHQFSGVFVADLPVGRNRWLGGNVEPAVNQIIGGWQLSGIVVAATGRPFNYTANRFNHHFQGRDQPHVSSPIEYELSKTSTGVFMIPGTNADRLRITRENFTNSHPGGAIARNQGRGPGYWNVDFAVTKSFDLSSLGESMKLRFRWETFNLFNHPNFGIPGLTPAFGATNIDRGGTLGQIESTIGTERVMQFGMRFEF